MSTQKADNTKTYKLGVALSGGGAKGFAHLGVMQALQDNGISPDIISGTSAGALAGVLIADGYEPHDIITLFEKKAFKQFAQITMPKCGFFHTKPFYAFLEKHLTARTFEELKIPLLVVATDIEEGKSHTFSSGPLLETIVASCAFPIVFSPVEIGGKHYVDGGLFKNFPVSIIRKQCKTIIGVNVSPLNRVKYRESLKYIIERSYHYLSISNTFLDRQLCDILLELANLNEYPMFDLEHPREIYQRGYNFTLKWMEENEHKLSTFVH
ncbi:patatin-like phospholipase family protein [Dysgonomonas sp. 25]|uniref:patatin-like phospholipase family protein n=1 Tax=Dysgonomonas sp. 25 TaxID=2302933 RepID=UPI0013D74977|nr:patatin-like phospholipase family protein [Dysgonomonas sp. 25]NDV68675.1 phospholipase [Dysgonomonas sp. 25]